MIIVSGSKLAPSRGKPGKRACETPKSGLRGLDFLLPMGADMTDYIQVMTTVENKSDAEKIARHLVEEKIAACVQILGPLQSYFQWQGKLDRADEYLCLIKSRNDLFHEIEAAIKILHPYEVPEIIAMPIIMGGADYLNWLAAELEA